MTKAIAKKPSPDHHNKRKQDAPYWAFRSSHAVHSNSYVPTLQLKPICPCDGGCPRCVGVIQPKLTIGQPNDIYEQEADRVAEQVMRMPEPKLQRQCTTPGCEEEEIRPMSISPLQLSSLVQRQEEIKEEEEEVLQAKQVDTKEGNEIDEAVILQSKGSGQPLDKGTREFMEPRFGYDFSNVRIHTDSNAAKLTTQLGAEAFTVGKDVFFGSGKYNPASTQGKRLLGHELTHVVQQEIKRTTFGNQAMQRLFKSAVLQQAKLKIGQPNDIYEQEADRVAEQVMRMPETLAQRQSRTDSVEEVRLQRRATAWDTSDLRITLFDFLRMQEERFVPIYHYMEENETRFLSLSEWVASVRRDVPEVVNISNAEIELAVRQGAERYNINIPPLPLFPQPAGGVTEEQPLSERLANAFRNLGDQLKTLIETLTTHGNPESIEVTLGFNGIETAFERSGFRFSWTVGWRGQLGARLSYRAFNGELSFTINSDWIAPEENPTFSVTLQFGPSEPNYARLQEIFDNAGSTLTSYIEGLIEGSRGVSNEQISETETLIEDMISEISDAVDQIDAMHPDEEEEFPPVTFSFQVGYGVPSLLPSEEVRPEPPAGIYVQGVLTFHF